jgi:hypothetical protein
VLAAFFALAASDPGILFVSVVKGNSAAFWTPENHFSTNDESPVITVVTASHAGSVRARFSACPTEPVGCRPNGEPFTLELPAGSRTLHFPEAARPVTVDLQRVPWHPFFLAFLLLLAGAAWLAFRDAVVRWLVWGVLFTSGLYLSQTSGQTRGLDVSGHLVHVQRIATDGLFVNAQACWECFHPPLYYLLASTLLGFPTMLRPWSASALQGFSLVLQCLSVPLVVAALRPAGRGLLLYAALVLLWPAAVLGSVRLGNDSLLNFCAFGVILLLLRRRLLWAACLTAAALLVKESAIVLVALVAAWGALAVFRPRDRVGAGLILAGGLGLSCFVARLKAFDPTRMDALAEPLRVRNTFLNVALPDPVAFLREPFVNPWVASGNREHLMNYFWKSSLFGEWGYEFPFSGPFALALSLALLCLLSVAAFSWWRAGRPLFPALLLAVSFAAVTGYRLLHPFASNPDFRFVYPTASLGIALCLAHGRVRYAPHVVAAFLLLSELTFVFHWWFEA